jgi:hypothetical protein
VFFVATYISKIFELLFLAKKSATGGAGSGEYGRKRGIVRWAR